MRVISMLAQVGVDLDRTPLTAPVLGRRGSLDEMEAELRSVLSLEAS